MKTAPAPVKPRRLEDMSTGRGGHFRFTLDQLTIPEGYNPRTEFHGIPELAESILAESTDELVGLLNPLRIRKVKGTEIIEVLDGERRIRAIRHLAAKGHAIGLIPCIPEQQGTTDLQRDLVPLVANTGQELTFLEKARQYQRLIERHSIKPAELARRCQTTKQAISDALRLVSEATPLLISCVASGKMSGTTALAIIRQAQASNQEIDTLTLATEQAAEATGSDHITPKHIPTGEPVKPAASQPEPTGEPSFQAASQPESSSLITDPPAPGTDHPPATPHFTLYQIEDAPTDPIEGTTRYHETDRLVLTNAPDSIGLLHLLIASTDRGFAYGYRRDDFLLLPCTSLDSLGKGIEDGLRWALDLALEGFDMPPEDTDAIAEALFTALSDYFPDEGEGKQPETLAFTPPGQEPETGYKRILNAPSTNRDGSAPGKGEGGFSPPDKQLEKIEKVLEDLDKKGTGWELAITTTEIVLAVIRNERPIADLRKHLEGK